MNLENLKDISSKLLYIVAELRRPWRWDAENNIKILKMLNENEDNGIEEDFYYSMHLNGFNFVNKQ